jgi:hypothetical protein
LAGVGAAVAGTEEPDARLRRGFREFLDWAHPPAGDCDAVRSIDIGEQWAGGFAARYEIPCAGAVRTLAGLFTTRSGEGVWQVASGFEIAPVDLERASAVRRSRKPSPAARPPESAPDAMRAVVPPAIRERVDPEVPEEAGRARLIGEARVELLVEVDPDGTPVRARSLRGPDPDLGMRKAAVGAALRWRFDPADLGGIPVRYFLPVNIPFQGLPAQSRDWIHRALFQVGAIVSPDAAALAVAKARLLAGEPFAAVARDFPGEESGDWGLVSAAALPGPLRVALHEARIGVVAGPVEAEGRQYVLEKRGEVYYAIQSPPGEPVTYRVLHQRNGPEGEALRRVIEADIAEYFADSRRHTYMDEAARLMGIGQVVTDLGLLRIHTDALDPDEVKVLGQVVQSVIAAHAAFWRPIVALRPLRQRVDVYAFARTADHDRLFRLLRSGDAGPGSDAGAGDGESHPAPAGAAGGWAASGEYIPASRILAVATEEMGGHLPVTVVVHETIHMLDYERVYDAGVRPSQWFEEGLASYFRFSQLDARLGIDPGAIRRSGVIIAGTVRLQFDPRQNLLDYLRRRGERPLRLQRLIEARPADPLWTGRQAAEAYGASWTLVHFLLHGDKGRHRGAFQRYAALEARGAAPVEAFRALFGPDLDALETAWRAYEERL